MAPGCRTRNRGFSPVCARPLEGPLPTRRGNDRDPRMLTQPTGVKASVGGRLATLLSRRRVVEVLSVHLLADHPNLISDVGIRRWKEWGYGDPDPQSWIKVTAAEAGRDRLPITLVPSIPPGGLLARWHSVLQIRNSMTASAATVHHGCWASWCANKTGGVTSVVY
jgi:hypothetical protein